MECEELSTCCFGNSQESLSGKNGEQIEIGNQENNKLSECEEIKIEIDIDSEYIPFSPDSPDLSTLKDEMELKEEVSGQLTTNRQYLIILSLKKFEI